MVMVGTNREREKERERNICNVWALIGKGIRRVTGRVTKGMVFDGTNREGRKKDKKYIN